MRRHRLTPEQREFIREHHADPERDVVEPAIDRHWVFVYEHGPEGDERWLIDDRGAVREHTVFR